MKSTSDNYLDYIPDYKKELAFTVSEDGKVILLKENTGLMNTIAQKLFNRPKVSQIHLDEMGCFIWPLIDGNRSILDISVLVKEEFGDKAEPLYNRLVQYMRNLESYGFITIKKNTDC